MGSQQAHKIRLFSDSHDPADAARALTQPGDATFVVRGVVRSLVLRCPCGCGENYIINLDARAGPAWRYYRRNGTLSLYPSYWRDGGCGSHFIINRNQIWWCHYDENWLTDADPALVEKVFAAAPTDGAIAPRELADQIDEIPWDVWAACEKLVRRQLFERIGHGVDTRYRRL